MTFNFNLKGVFSLFFTRVHFSYFDVKQIGIIIYISSLTLIKKELALIK